MLSYSSLTKLLMYQWWCRGTFRGRGRQLWCWQVRAIWESKQWRPHRSSTLTNCSLFQLGRASDDTTPSTNHQDSTRGCGCLSVPVSRSSGKRSGCDQGRTVHCPHVLFQLFSKRTLWTSMLCRNDTCLWFGRTENRGCPTGPVHSGARSRRLFPSPRTLKSAFLFARDQTTQCRSSTLTGSSTSQCLRFLSRSWKPWSTFHRSKFSSALYYRSPPRVEDIGEVLPGRISECIVEGSTTKHWPSRQSKRHWKFHRNSILIKW